MKNKWLKPVCIGFVLLLTGIQINSCFDSFYQSPPSTQSGVFPFHFVYELDGIRFDIKDAVVCNYTGVEGLLHTRGWTTYLESGMDDTTILQDENVVSVLVPERINTTIRVFLDYGSGEFYMGDPNAKSAIHAKPHICYIEVYNTTEYKHTEDTPLTTEQAEKYFGIKIIKFEFSEPIKNKF